MSWMVSHHRSSDFAFSSCKARCSSSVTIGIRACIAPRIFACAVASTWHYCRAFRRCNFFRATTLAPRPGESGLPRCSLPCATLTALSARPVRRRRTRRHPLCQDPWHQASALAHSTAGAAADEGRRHRARQQDRPDGLGNDGQGRALQGTSRACGVNEIAPDIRRDVKVGRTNST
jgi:hypothetical protein